MHAPPSNALILVMAALAAMAAPSPAQVTSWSAFNDFYVNVPATGGNGDYTQSSWTANAGVNPYDTGLTNANAWGYAGGNFNGGGFPSSVGTYVSGGGLYPLTSGGTYAGPGASFNLGDGNFWIGYNDNYGSVGLPNAQTQIGKYTLEWFSGTPNYANNPSGVNNKYLWVQSTGLSSSSDGLGAIVSWTAPTSGTFYFSGSYVNGNYGQTTDFAIVDSTGIALLAKTNLAASSPVRTYGFNRTLSAGDVVQYQVGVAAAAQSSPLGLEANIAAANWNAYRDFYLAPTASGWTGATTPGLMGGAWGYYDANVNGSGYPSQIGSFYTTDGSGSGSQSLYKLSTNSPLGSATLVGASGWANTGGAGFPYYADTYGWGSSLGRYDTPWFSGAPQATNRIWMQAGYLNGPGVEGIAPVLSWTAPASGYYTVDGSWVVANQTGGGASLAIADNSGLTYDRYAAAMGSTNPFTYTKYYAAGTVIQFQVGSDFKTGAPVGLAADISGTGSSNSAYFVNTGMSATESSSLGGSGSLTKSGNGTLILSGANTYTGGTTVSAGQLSMGASNVLSDSGAVTVAAGGTLSMGANNETVGTFTMTGGTLAGSGTLTAATYALNGGTVTANLGAGTATASSGTTALDGTLGATTVNVSGGTVNLGANDRLADGATVNVSSGTLGMGTRTDTVGTLNVSGGSVTGSTGNKLTATTYNLTGGTVGANLGAGTLNANSGSATLNGTADATTVNVGGGALTLGSAGRLASGAAVTVSSSGTLTLGGNETISSLAGSGGTLALGANSLTVSSGNFGSLITGTGILTKIGSGTLTLSGANTYSGGTFLNGGTLDSDSSSAFGTGFIIVGSGTTLDLQSHNVANSITNNGGTILSTGTLDDVVATNGTTDIGGDGTTVTEVGGSATVNVSGSSVVVSNADGGTLNSSGSSTTVDTVSGTAVVNLGGTGAQVNTLGGGTVTFSNGATGSSVGTMSNGTLNANVALVVSNYNGGNIDVASRTDVTLRSGSSAGVISGAGGIAKQGATTLTLSGNNTFTGTTSVEEGRLVVAQGGSLASTTTTVTGSTLTVNGTVAGAVTASSGGVVGGSGTVGTLNIFGGGVFAPGNSAGTTTATSGATWNQGGSYDWEIFNLAGPAGTGWDLLSVTSGTLDLTGITGPGGFTINLITLQSNNSTQGALTGFVPTATYTNWMIASAPMITGFNANKFNLNSSLFVGATGTFALEERGGDLFLTYTAGGAQPVPEPGTWAAAALLALGAACVHRRRKSRNLAES